MNVYLFSSLLIILTISDNDLKSVKAQQMRVAPGVPPQHYEHQQQQFNQPPPPPQGHGYQQQQQGFQGQGQPPQHHQQQFVPQHQQQPPQHQQQFQQPPPQQAHVQNPPGHDPHGHGHHGGQQILDASNLSKERQHIQEHMDVPIDTSQMSEQELQFHYFKMHDADNNNKLDGCELVKSLIHWHDQSNHDPKAGQAIPEAKIFGDEELINMIDPILKNDDKNGDGFIDYAEFSLAQASAAAKAKTQQ